MDTKAAIVVIVIAIAVAFFDELAHTSAGVLSYFDNYVPSFLTVLGWGLFIVVIIAVAEVMMRISTLAKLDTKNLRILPALFVVGIIPLLVFVLGYASVFTLELALVYVVLGILSLYYAYSNSLGWNIAVLVSSVMIGGFMELIGSIEGLWTYYFLEPLPLFMAFIWALRTWAILAFCSFLKVEFGLDTTEWVKELLSGRLSQLPPLTDSG
jgi:hypothetical protein